MESLGLLLSHYFSDCGNDLDGSESCFSINQNRFRVIGDNGHCALWLPDASDVSRVMRAIGLGQAIRVRAKIPCRWLVIRDFASLDYW